MGRENVKNGINRSRGDRLNPAASLLCNDMIITSQHATTGYIGDKGGLYMAKSRTSILELRGILKLREILELKENGKLRDFEKIMKKGENYESSRMDGRNSTSLEASSREEAGQGTYYEALSLDLEAIQSIL